jgi:hypothetical protein
MADLTYLRGSTEFKSITVTADGVPQTTGVSFSVVPEAPGVQPGTFTPAVTEGGKVGFMLGSFGPGCWRIFAKVDAGTEQPELDCDIFYIR